MIRYDGKYSFCIVAFWGRFLGVFALESYGWLYRWFARVFTKDDCPQKVVGYSIHLGNYEPSIVSEEKMQQLWQLGVSL
jgi:hypothetical protein